MEQVLRASDDGVLVYVAPTKALVSQIAAEVYARFNKTFVGTGSELTDVWTFEGTDRVCICQRRAGPSIRGTTK